MPAFGYQPVTGIAISDSKYRAGINLYALLTVHKPLFCIGIKALPRPFGPFPILRVQAMVVSINLS
jgi:hypothetical protein